MLVALVVATWPLFAWPLRDRFGARAWLVPPLASLALLPFVTAGAMWARAQPVVDAMAFRCGTGDMALVLFAVPAAVVALVVSTLWARYVAAPPGRQRADATIRALAVLALAGGGALVVPAAVRATQVPDADGWAASLPRVGEVPVEVQAAAFEHFAWSFYDVRRDEARGLWVVTLPGDEGRRPVEALGPALIRRTVAARDLEGLAAPRGWILEAAGGLLAAGLAIAMARAAARRFVRRFSGVEATHLGGGWVAVDESGPPLHATELEASEPGPVIVRPVDAGGSGYRGSGAPVAVRVVARGTPANVDDAARSIATTGYAMALAIVVLACAPLAAS